MTARKEVIISVKAIFMTMWEVARLLQGKRMQKMLT